MNNNLNMHSVISIARYLSVQDIINWSLADERIAEYWQNVRPEVRPTFNYRTVRFFKD